MTACLCAVGNCDETREALTSLVMIGVKIFESDLTSQVGTGSSRHCLFGQRPSSRLVSKVVTGVNAVMRQSFGQMTDGCSAPAIESRMVFTLLWKNVADSFAVK